MYKPSHKDFSCIIGILDAIQKIQDYSGKFENADELYNDSLSFDATMMNFIVLGEMADKLSDQFLMETREDIEWHKVKGFRNIIAHNYFGIDAQDVWQIIQGSLIQLKERLEELIESAK